VRAEATESGWLALLAPRMALPLGVLLGGVLLHSMNVLVTATLLPSIVSDLGGANLMSWPTTAFVASSIIAATGSAVVGSAVGKASLGRSERPARRSIRSIRINAPIAAAMNALLIAGPITTLASDKRAIAAHIKTSRKAGTFRSVASRLTASAGRINNAAIPSRPPTTVIARKAP